MCSSISAAPLDGCEDTSYEPAMTFADLAADTKVSRLRAGPGWYTAELPDHWNYFTPSGGVLMTVALRAMAEELGDAELRPVSANTLFCSPVPAGPLQIRVEVIRHGGAAAQIRAALSSTTLPGPGLEVSATFARDREGFTFVDAAPPAVPRPDESIVLTDGREERGFPFFRQIEARLALGHLSPKRARERALDSDKTWSPGEARSARWFRYRVPQARDGGFLDPFAIPPIADTMPPALVEKLGPNTPPFEAPSLDLTVHFLEPTRSEWLLVHARSRCARKGYATADVEIFGEDGALAAFATQTMILRRRRAVT